MGWGAGEIEPLNEKGYFRWRPHLKPQGGCEKGASHLPRQSIPTNIATSMSDLRYTIKEFDEDGIEPIDCLAAAQHIDAARAAYDALLIKFPEKKLAICQKIMILARNFDRPRSVTEPP